MVWAILLFAIVAILVAVIKAKSLRSKVDEVWPLEQTIPLSVVEQKLYWRLIKSLPDHVVLAQVQLSRFMSVRKVERAQSWRNKIDRKSADFLLCDKDFSIVAVIELDDSSHARANRRKADTDKDAALKSAGIRIIRWTTKTMPDEGVIRESVLGIIPIA